MIDFDSDLGKRALERIDGELVVWLTTVDSDGMPQPRPVWFVWQAEGFLIYSQSDAHKLEHIAQNPNVAVHFDGGPKGMDIQVFLGAAEVLSDPTPTDQLEAFSQKYRDEIRALGANEEDFAATYNTAVRVTPQRLRGMVDPELG